MSVYAEEANLRIALVKQNERWIAVWGPFVALDDNKDQAICNLLRIIADASEKGHKFIPTNLFFKID